LLEIRQLQQEVSTEGLQQALQASSIPANAERKSLDDFLPDDNLVRLQQFSHELELPLYPQTGILDLSFVLHAQGRSLYKELRVHEEEE
jgi:hypothetical protein